MPAALAHLPGVCATILVVSTLALIGIRLGPRFVVRRIATLIVTLFGAASAIFALGSFAPYDLIYVQGGVHGPPSVDRALVHLMGLDLPWYTAYGAFLGRLIHFHFGATWIDRNVSVGIVLAPAIPVSATLALEILVIVVVVGLPVGLLLARLARDAHSRVAGAIRIVQRALSALPSVIVIPIMLLTVFWLAQRKPGAAHTSGLNIWGSMGGSGIVVAVAISAVYALFVAESLARDAHEASGHATPPRRRPVETLRRIFRATVAPFMPLSPLAGLALTGLVMGETLVQLPGIGEAFVRAAIIGDISIVQGAAMLLVGAAAGLNLIADIAYSLADSRVATASDL